MPKNNPIVGDHDDNTVQQFNAVMENADGGALMADGHLGYVMPIGGVAAYKNHLSPAGVGYDIGCGNLAVKLDRKAENIDVVGACNWIQRNIQFGIGRRNESPVDNLGELEDDEGWGAHVNKQNMYCMAKSQFGTVGSGNHYVDIFKDENGLVWVGLHFGSRGLGHKTTSGFLNLAINGKWDSRPQRKEKEVLFDVDSDIGQRYWLAMNLAGRYAYLAREYVADKVASYIGGEVLDRVHNHHNFAWKEEHDGEEYYVIRKGATPAFPGQRGFIGGSMGDKAVIIEGIDSDKSKRLLYSTIHGAGRVMSRSQAKGNKKRKGKVMQDEMIVWLRERGVVLRGGGLDEAPQVYRRLPKVLKHHKNTIRVQHELTPLGVVMAGDRDKDPYKD